MVCFDITLAYPLGNSYKGLLVQEQRMEHLRRYHNADILGSKTEDGVVYMRFAICDEEAVALLRDMPTPVYCVQIKILRTEGLLYSFWRLTQTKCVPPRDSKLLKDVYWSASQLERRLIKLPESGHVPL